MRYICIFCILGEFSHHLVSSGFILEVHLSQDDRKEVATYQRSCSQHFHLAGVAFWQCSVGVTVSGLLILKSLVMNCALLNRNVLRSITFHFLFSSWRTKLYGVLYNCYCFLRVLCLFFVFNQWESWDASYSCFSHLYPNKEEKVLCPNRCMYPDNITTHDRLQYKQVVQFWLLKFFGLSCFEF